MLSNFNNKSAAFNIMPILEAWSALSSTFQSYTFVDAGGAALGTTIDSCINRMFSGICICQFFNTRIRICFLPILSCKIFKLSQIGWTLFFATNDQIGVNQFHDFEPLFCFGSMLRDIALLKSKNYSLMSGLTLVRLTGLDFKLLQNSLTLRNAILF